MKPDKERRPGTLGGVAGPSSPNQTTTAEEVTGVYILHPSG